MSRPLCLECFHRADRRGESLAFAQYADHVLEVREANGGEWQFFFCAAHAPPGARRIGGEIMALRGCNFVAELLEVLGVTLDVPARGMVINATMELTKVGVTRADGLAEEVFLAQGDDGLRWLTQALGLNKVRSLRIEAPCNEAVRVHVEQFLEEVRPGAVAEALAWLRGVAKCDAFRPSRDAAAAEMKKSFRALAEAAIENGSVQTKLVKCSRCGRERDSGILPYARTGLSGAYCSPECLDAALAANFVPYDAFKPIELNAKPLAYTAAAADSPAIVEAPARCSAMLLDARCELPQGHSGWHRYAEAAPADDLPF